MIRGTLLVVALVMALLGATWPALALLSCIFMAGAIHRGMRPFAGYVVGRGVRYGNGKLVRAISGRPRRRYSRRRYQRQ